MEMKSYLCEYMLFNWEEGFDVWDPDFNKLPKKLPKATILEYVKGSIMSVGYSYIDGWSNCLNSEDTNKLLKWAEDIILRAFPELEKSE